MQPATKAFLKPNKAKIIIFLIPLIILFVWGVAKDGIGGGILALIMPVVIFCEISAYLCAFSDQMFIIGPIIIYFIWYLISCLLVFGYQKIKARK